MDSRTIGRLGLGICMWALACNTGGDDGDAGGSGGGSSADDTMGSSDTVAPTVTQTGDASAGSMSGTMTSTGTTSGPTTSDTTIDPSTTDSSDSGSSSSGDVPGCNGIDFLFVIDNSGSMDDFQDQLVASFPGFISAIEASLGNITDNYHVGVITSDDYAFNEPGCQGLGDLVTQTGGQDSSNQMCTPFVEGNRFATEMDDLSVAFPCMAQVGTEGSSIELPVTGAIAALTPGNGCNTGFIRDEAILVVVIVTDDPPFVVDQDDANLMADTSGWYDAVLAAKNNDPEAVVVVGLVPWMDTSCTFMNLESPNLISFVESFGEQGVLGSICESDYGPFFASAVGTIVDTCTEFR